MTSVKWKSRTFMAGTTISKDSSPAARTARAHLTDVGQHLQNILIEAEIANAGGDFAILDEEAAVAGHAGKNFFVGIDFANVPKAGEQNAAIGSGDHGVQRRSAAGEDEVEGRFAILIRQWQAVAGGFGFHFFGRRSRIDEMARHAAIDEQNRLPGQAFAIEGRAGLQGVRDVVVNAHVFAHDLLADAIGEAGALIDAPRFRRNRRRESRPDRGRRRARG